jgi:hypothetical protein
MLCGRQGHWRGVLNCSSNDSDLFLWRPGWCSLSSGEESDQASHCCLCLSCSCVNEYGRLWFPVQNCFNWQRWRGEDVPSPTIHSGKNGNPGVDLSVQPALRDTDRWVTSQCQPLGCEFFFFFSDRILCFYLGLVSDSNIQTSPWSCDYRQVLLYQVCSLR